MRTRPWPPPHRSRPLGLRVAVHANGVCYGHARGKGAEPRATTKEDNYLLHVIAQTVKLFASAAQPRVQCANLPPHALSVPHAPHVPVALA